MSRPSSTVSTVTFNPAPTGHPAAHPTREGAQYELHQLMHRHGRSKANRAGSRDSGFTRAGIRFCGPCGGWHAGRSRRAPRSRVKFAAFATFTAAEFA